VGAFDGVAWLKLSRPATDKTPETSDPDSRLTATRASGATARRRRREMRAGSGWPHVGHLLVAVIRVPSLNPISTVSMPTACRGLAKILRSLPDRLTLHGDRRLGTRPAGSRLIAPNNEHRPDGAGV
jgi:hypothetical protein